MNNMIADQLRTCGQKLELKLPSCCETTVGRICTPRCAERGCGVELSRGKKKRHSRNGLCKDEFLREMCGRDDNGERN